MNDILLNNDYDLAVSNGDFVIGNNLIQRQKLIVGTGKNDWKQSPDIGVGAEMYLDDENDVDLFAEIREQFRKDGLTAKTVKSKDGTIYINAESNS